MIHIANASSQCVIVDINGSGECSIPAGQSISSDLCYPETITVTLRHQTESYTKSDDAHLNLVTTYTLSLGNDARLTVVREKIRFDLNGYYDRFFLSAQGAQILSIHNEASNVEGVRKGLKRYQILEATLIEPPLDLLIDPFIGFGIIGGLVFYIALIVLSSIFHLWSYVLLVYAGLWLLFAVVGLVSDKTLRLFTRKVGILDETALTQLSKWTDPVWINQYYSQSDRKPFMDSVEN